MKTGIFAARTSVLVLALSNAYPAIAQTKAEPALNEVVVTASRNPQLLSSVAAHSTVITREEIESSQATDLVVLLQREAGLQRTQTGGIGTTSTVFMRGLPALDTLILIDGVPQNKQDASGAVSLEHIMLDNVERIEVVRGNVSAIYGSGAIGGVIQIFTRTGSSTPRASVRVEVGPRATTKLAGNVSTGFGDTTLQVGSSRFISDGFSSVSQQSFATANPDNDSYQNTSANVSLTHNLSAQHRFGVQASYSDGATNYDNPYGAATDLQFSRTLLNQASVFTDNTFGTWRSRLTLSNQSDRSTTWDNGLFGSTNTFVTRTSVLTWVNTLPLGDNWLATAGAEHQDQHVDTGSTDPFTTPYDRNRASDSLFAGLEGTFGPLSAQVNVRNDQISDLKQSTGYLGLGYALTQQVKLFASKSTAFNAPPLGYLFAPGYGNPLLKPELAESDEVGLQWGAAGHQLRATYFDTRMTDQLVYSTATFAFANVNRTRNNGFEVSYKGTLGNTDLNASYTDQNPVDETAGLALTRRSKTMLSLGATTGLGAWRVGGNVRYAGERTDRYSDPATFASVTTRLPAYTVLDLTATYKLSSQVLLTGRLDNVLDEKYQTVYGYAQQPQSLYVGVTWTPKL